MKKKNIKRTLLIVLGIFGLLVVSITLIIWNAGIVAGIPNSQFLINFRINTTDTSNGIDNEIGNTTRNWVQAVFL